MKKALLIATILILPLQLISAQSEQNQPEARINHIAVAVTDLEESAQFYEEVIGLRPIPEPFGVGMHAWFDIGGGAELHVIAAAEERRERNIYNHLCFSVTDMAAFTANLDAHGIVWSDFNGNVGEFNERPDGVLQIYFTDPDGYWIEVNDDM